ncbi:MBL fold metallo-hydrolase [Paractinoplanes atraurantiacus]|uniref:Glyoxylase, beta-lactamase superfamily II n=1 Tax=Paractinoplanes atraurantiacus TaxID=1036182 RepID=A0A285IUN4_9ACTN|nr:MBL fold metallo-hydrolase [Actinoplanes atraurantiacus]SNY51688.1 Glyoxylase, beta-lactamase superfamily II [Actinoplanes atraurantiacus]
MPVTHAVGRLTVIALEDAEGPFFMPRAEAFPDATAEQWAAADAADPAAVTAEGEWWLRFRSYAVRAGDGPVTLVDAGIGPAGSLAADWAPVPGRLPGELAAAGIDPAEVETIVLTHLHNDHMGWAVPRDSPFTAARVVVQRADVALYEANRDQAGQFDLLVEPLRAEGRLHELDGDLALAPGIRVVATPGHTPGHQSVLVEDGDDSLLVAGDMLVHAIQLLHPELAYASDFDPAQARATRQRALKAVKAVAVSHLGEAFRQA